jgi:hypothetical protein
MDMKSELKKWNAQSDEEVLQATLEDVRRFLRSKGSSIPTFGVSRGRYWYAIHAYYTYVYTHARMYVYVCIIRMYIYL